MSLDLYPHNRQAYDAALTLLKKNGKAAVIHPTGTGKSYIGFELAWEHPGDQVLWLTPSEYIVKTQLEILDHASQAVRPGGVLVYATCSMFRRENASVVHAFLEGHPDFRLEPFPNPLTGEMNSGMQQIMPWDADCDASFAARMRRN